MTQTGGRRWAKEKGKKMFSWLFLKSGLVAAAVAADNGWRVMGLEMIWERCKMKQAPRQDRTPPSSCLVSKWALYFTSKIGFQNTLGSPSLLARV